MYKDLSLAALRLNIFCKVEEKDECLQLGAPYAKDCYIQHSQNTVLLDVNRFVPFTECLEYKVMMPKIVKIL